MRIEIGARSDVGRARKNNEDDFRVEAALDLYLLSDGMGGEAHGEVASRIAVETILEQCRAALEDLSPAEADPEEDLSPRTLALEQAARVANQAIREAALKSQAKRGMGATIVAVWLDGTKASVLHVGDSRAYLLHGNFLDQITEDHSLVAEQVRQHLITPEQAERSRLSSVLTRALGAEASVEPAVRELDVAEGDTLLLCSDGLTRMVGTDAIRKMMLEAPDAQAAADQLVKAANEAGGADNITVIVVRLGESVGDDDTSWR